MFVYRDPDLTADAQDERDAAYWYDLPAAEGDHPAPVLKEPVTQARGPFEPLVSSSGPLPQPPSAEAAEAAHEEREDPGSARARKLEQIRDFYLTAEAIGEDNVGKHFDELLAQQRSLISDYFRQSPEAEPGQASGSPQGVTVEHPGA